MQSHQATKIWLVIFLWSILETTTSLWKWGQSLELSSFERRCGYVSTLTWRQPLSHSPSPTLLLLLHGTPCPLAPPPPPSPFPLTAPPIPPPPPPPPSALALPFLEIILACTAEPVDRRPTIMMMVLKVRNCSYWFSEVSKIDTSAKMFLSVFFAHTWALNFWRSWWEHYAQ